MPAATTTFLFDEPRSEIATLILERASKAEAIDIVTGFATLDGLKRIIEPIVKEPEKLRSIVIGKATTRACDALDYLDEINVPKERLKIHLGFAKDNTHLRNGEKYRPMIHSKLIYMDLPDKKACAFIGSHNLTAFALSGENGEAGVLIEGDRDDENLKKVKKQIDAISSKAIVYNFEDRLLYISWNESYICGLQDEMFPEEEKDYRTVLIFAVAPNCKPEINEDVHISLNKNVFNKMLGAEVHLYLFDELPNSPKAAYESRNDAIKRFIGKIEDVNSTKRKGKLNTNYCILNNRNPIIIQKDAVELVRKPEKNEERCIFSIKSTFEMHYDYFPKKAAQNPRAILEKSSSSVWKTVQNLHLLHQNSLFDQDAVVSSFETEYTILSYNKKSKTAASAQSDQTPLLSNLQG